MNRFFIFGFDSVFHQLPIAVQAGVGAAQCEEQIIGCRAPGKNTGFGKNRARATSRRTRPIFSESCVLPSLAKISEFEFCKILVTIQPL